jgi:hypothetical protein
MDCQCKVRGPRSLSRARSGYNALARLRYLKPGCTVQLGKCLTLARTSRPLHFKQIALKLLRIPILLHRPYMYYFAARLLRNSTLGEFDHGNRPLTIVASDRNPKPVQIVKPNCLDCSGRSVGEDDCFPEKFGLGFSKCIHDCSRAKCNRRHVSPWATDDLNRVALNQPCARRDQTVNSPGLRPKKLFLYFAERVSRP